MGQYWLNVAILRVILPATFTAAVVWRPSGLSLIYLLLTLISPFIPIPTTATMKSTTGVYLKLSIALSVLAAVAQLAFQVVLLSLPTLSAEFRENCSFLEELLRHIGLVRMDEASAFVVFYWLIPEIVVLPVTIITYYICRRTTAANNVNDPELTTTVNHSRATLKDIEDANGKIINFLGRIGPYVVMASICFTATLTPSVEAGFYFFIFIITGAWWACDKELSRGFAFICRVIMIVVMVHIFVLIIYQNQWPQEQIPRDDKWARYFALDPYYITNCTNPRNVIFTWEKNEWTGYSYILRLFWVYYILALQSQFLFRKPKPSDASATQPDERTPLMRFSSGRSGLLQDSTGSVIVQDTNPDEGIQMQSVSEDPPEDNPGIIEHVIMAVYSILQLIINSSYLATNIMMMTWSIMYHSWTTFVFLLWALVLWMVPNKRAIMMKCSPFIVLYGSILLLISYIYSMNLTEDELPTIIYRVNMTEMGFPKANEISNWHLAVKCGFLTMFWITMRQYMAERREKRQASALRDMVAPLHVSVTAATALPTQQTPEIKSQFMKDVGTVVQRLLTKFWIVVVAIMLFTSGITGERMTVFRIIYMSLFLFFVISFQISWTAWRKMMFGFWITVIAYSVIMLILVYTYQFRNFPANWDYYLHIGEDLQKDIGLEVYQTKDLFVRLLTPTFFVIISVLQIHYFHDDFLEVTNIEKISVETTTKRDSLGRSKSIPRDDVSTIDVLLAEGDNPSTFYTLKQLKRMSKMERIAFLKHTLSQIKTCYNYLWLTLEIHMQKLIFGSIILLCLNDVCAINLIFVIVVVVSINLKRATQIVAINGMAVAIACLTVTKMLYQITYIDHHRGDVNCTSEIPGPEDTTINRTETYNIAEWIGMKKVEPTMLPDLLKGYIGIVVITTVRGIIMVRQCFYRHGRGEPLDTPQIMFPAIKRADADRGIAECLKFMLNYGFYKFGVELCLIALVGLIGARLDLYSVIYGIWLACLFAQTRKNTARIWPFFTLFGIIIVPLQYSLIVAPPTWLCIDYPWEKSEFLRKFQEWMFLPDPESPPNAKKLIWDFLLLFMVVRQSLVFRIESRCAATGAEFVAGHNFSVYRDFDKPNFVNPVKDYVSHIHCWLDVVKRGTMMSFLWITLSIMFLAGTKRTNLFSLGYLLGAFIFLWQGSDFYLRPVNVIIKWWNMLIGYNVTVIVCKAILQGMGCVVLEDLEQHACILIQLLGITCTNRIISPVIDTIGCIVPTEPSSMTWDALCFACLIIQKRLFKSYYFFHIIDETKAMSILASRGGELLEDIHRKRIEFRENVERNVLQKIKLKMDKIKADQQKIQGPTNQDPTAHQVGMAPLARASSAGTCVSPGHTPPQGYRTPIDDDTDDDDADVNVNDSDNDDNNSVRLDEIDDDPAPLTPRAASLLQAPSPNSAILTVSLDGYLEPTRISFSSPPNSELNPRGVSPDETYPVFSPPPYDDHPPATSDRSVRSCRSYCGRRPSSYNGTTWMSEIPTTAMTPRQSIVSYNSRSHHTYSVYPRDRPLYRHRAPKTNREAVRSGDYYMFDDFDDDDDDPTDLLQESDMEAYEEDQRRQAKSQGRRMTVSELITTLFKTDIEIATHVAMYGGTTKDAMRLRRQSLPLTRKKSSMSYLSARSDSESAEATDAPKDGQSEARQSTSAGTSKIADDTDVMDRPLDDDTATVTSEDRKRVSLMTYIKFVIQLINSSMVSATKYLNQFSRDYRYIRKVLAKEKRQLKAKPDFRIGTRLGINQIWQPIPLMKESSRTEDSIDETVESTDANDGPSQSKNQSERLPVISQWSTESLRKLLKAPLKIIKKGNMLSVPRIRILAPSLERGLDESSSSELLSRIQQTQEEDVEPELSEVDQPPIIQLLASIWFGILAHSTLLCYFMIFLHQINNHSLLSTPLPLMVFCWGSLTIPRPSKTFWVTIIAYTEAIVIVKCICQLDMLPWNTGTFIEKSPVDPIKIIGLERQANYALWDLLLLLVVFFHRYMLKTVGQWATSSSTRKIIPTKLLMASTGGTPENSQESTRFTWQNERKIRDNTKSTGSNVNNIKSDDNNEQIGTENFHENDEEQLVAIETEDTSVCNQSFTKAVTMTFYKYLEPTKIFFQDILSPVGKEKTNVYAYMFLCDFFNFLLIIFKFQSFGPEQSDDDVTVYLQENRVPLTFLMMLLFQFALIVIDRALYLRKSIKGKLVFQYFLIFGVHIWMFFVLLVITEREFTKSLAPQIWYMVKCFYLLLAAYQLRLGYPTRILGNFLCKNYSMINYCLFKVFMLVPFLFELRAVQDWMWTTTTMTISDWFKMEDIFASIYQTKCMRGLENDYPQPRGVKKKQSSKYLVGGGLLLIIIGLIWFPLLFFALGRTAGVPNIPYEVSLTIRLGSHEPVYTMTAENNSIIVYKPDELKDMKNQYADDKLALNFLENYSPSDVAAVRLGQSSQKLWAISPPDRERLRDDLLSNETMNIHVIWQVSRKTDVKELEDTTTQQRNIDLPAYIDGKFNSVRENLAAMLDPEPYSAEHNIAITLPYAFPKFLKVTSRTTTPVKEMMRLAKLYESYGTTSGTDNDNYLYRNVTLRPLNEDMQQWWVVNEMCDDPLYNRILQYIPLNNCNYIMIFLFNDKALPPTLSFISGFGILGLYTTGVILISQIMRRAFSDMAPKIMFDDMPYVDRILRLCLDIYLVRESKELALEEDLFAKLIFLYRSPETLIRWTRPPEPTDVDNDDGNDDDDDDDENDEGPRQRVRSN